MLGSWWEDRRNEALFDSLQEILSAHTRTGSQLWDDGFNPRLEVGRGGLKEPWACHTSGGPRNPLTGLGPSPGLLSTLAEQGGGCGVPA